MGCLGQERAQHQCVTWNMADGEQVGEVGKDHRPYRRLDFIKWQEG